MCLAQPEVCFAAQTHPRCVHFKNRRLQLLGRSKIAWDQASGAQFESLHHVYNSQIEGWACSWYKLLQAHNYKRTVKCLTKHVCHTIDLMKSHVQWCR